MFPTPSLSIILSYFSGSPGSNLTFLAFKTPRGKLLITFLAKYTLSLLVFTLIILLL